MKKIQLFIALVLLATSVLAQRNPVIVSPEVGSGNSVTFRFSAINAKEVLLEAQFLKDKLPMQKD